MVRVRYSAVVVMLVTALGAGFFLRSVQAAVPTTEQLTYNGRLTNSGAPVNDTLDIRVELYPDNLTATAFTCATGPSSTDVVDGRFKVPVDACAGTLQATGDLWLGVNIGGVKLPRSKVGAVPYALEAAHAVVADSARDAVGSSPLDGRLTTAEGRLTTVEGRVTTVEGRAGSAESRLTALEAPHVFKTSFSEDITGPCRSVYNNADSASAPLACIRKCDALCSGQGYTSGFLNGYFAGGGPFDFGCTCVR